jgi:hypothetical protein
MPLITDEERLQSIIALTAEFRYRICWMGARKLLQERGIDPMSVLQLSCDQGFDVHTDLLLPGGELVDVDFIDDPNTRELVSVNRWEVATWSDRQVELARQMISPTEKPDFDRRVQQYFNEHWRGKDLPLPPVK